VLLLRNHELRCLVLREVVVPAKLSMPSVVDVFWAEGYILLSMYESYSKPLRVVCPYGHVSHSSVERFRRGQRCKKCASRALSTTLEQVLDTFSPEGYTVCSSAYVNSHTAVKYVCPAGHNAACTLANFTAGKRCPHCYKGALHTHESFSSLVSAFGYSVIRGVYKNNYTKILLRCPRGHEVMTAPLNFLSGKRCRVCSKEDRVVPLGVVRDELAKSGYTVLKYKRAAFPITLKCPRGHVTDMYLYNFRKGHRCKHCASSGVSSVASSWLSQLGIKCREVPILGFRVDGFDPKTGTVYEFLGGFWHGDSRFFDPSDVNPVNGALFGELLAGTEERLSKISKHYNIVCIWEYDYHSGVSPTCILKGGTVRLSSCSSDSEN